MTDQAPKMPILDVRSREDFERGHPSGAVNIPLEELAERMSELPPPDLSLQIFDADPERLKRACTVLEASGRQAVRVARDPTIDARNAATGPSSNYLWRPHGLVERALSLMKLAWGGIENKVALDLAAGVGRDAARLALAGFDVHAWDVLPDALDRAARLARNSGTTVTTKVVDLEQDDFALPVERFDAIACFHYLHRPLLRQMGIALRPGGFVIYETFTVEQRERIGKPRKDKHLLRPGELASYFESWNVWWNAEGLTDDRWVASLIAQKPYRVY